MHVQTPASPEPFIWKTTPAEMINSQSVLGVDISKKTSIGLSNGPIDSRRSIAFGLYTLCRESHAGFVFTVIALMAQLNLMCLTGARAATNRPIS